MTRADMPPLPPCLCVPGHHVPWCVAVERPPRTEPIRIPRLPEAQRAREDVG